MRVPFHTDDDAARALQRVLPDNPWEVAAIASGFVAQRNGASLEDATRIVRKQCKAIKVTECRALMERAALEGFRALLPPRKRTGSAENFITKHFPATIVEERFRETLQGLLTARPSLSMIDSREGGNKYTDFVLREADAELPINVKHAGTMFDRAQEFVGIAPDDCLPIPAYKAYGAIEQLPNLLYVVSIDYELVHRVGELLDSVLSNDEKFVWKLLEERSGRQVRKAEDAFVWGAVHAYWARFKEIAASTPFHAISARRAIRILITRPERTPGIARRAWGTSAAGETNVHISVSRETTPWDAMSELIRSEGLGPVIAGISRQVQEVVHDPTF